MKLAFVFLFFALFLQTYAEDVATPLTAEEMMTPLTEEEFDQASEAVNRPLDGENDPTPEDMALMEEEEEEEEEEEFNPEEHPEHNTEITSEEMASIPKEKEINNTVLSEFELATPLTDEEFEASSDDDHLPETPEAVPEL